MTLQAWVLIFTGIVLAIVCVCAFMRCKSSVRESDNDWLAEISEPFRADYDAVSEPLPTGWQGWEGGMPPVSPNTIVTIMQRNGRIVENKAAADLDWWIISYRDCYDDIVAWRVAD